MNYQHEPCFGSGSLQHWHWYKVRAFLLYSVNNSNSFVLCYLVRPQFSILCTFESIPRQLAYNNNSIQQMKCLIVEKLTPPNCTFCSTTGSQAKTPAIIILRWQKFLIFWYSDSTGIPKLTPLASSLFMEFKIKNLILNCIISCVNFSKDWIKFLPQLLQKPLLSLKRNFLCSKNSIIFCNSVSLLAFLPQ